MLERLGHFLVRRRRWVLIGTLLTIVLAGVFGGNVAQHLKAGGFDPPDVESSRASDLLGKSGGQLVSADDEHAPPAGRRLLNEPAPSGG